MSVLPASMRRWFSDRLGGGALVERMRHRMVPSRTPTHYLGGLLAFLFLVQVASGILLLLPYRPSPSEAHASIINIIGRIPYGGLVRGVHLWSSHLFVAVLLAQIFSMMALRRFTAPRELVWLTGLLLLAMGIGMAFTGAILPWNQNAYLQALVSSDLIGQTPLVGPLLEHFVRGGAQVGNWTLHHAYGFHTGVLPATVTMLIAFHVMLVIRAEHGPAAAPPTARQTVPMVPDFAVRLAVLCTGALVLVITLATFKAQPLGVAADPRLPAPIGIAPPWYFLFLHQILKSTPAHLLGVAGPKFVGGGLSVILLGLLVLPFVDKRGSRFSLWAALTLLVIWLVLTLDALF